MCGRGRKTRGQEENRYLYKSQVTDHKSLRRRRTYMLARYYAAGFGRMLQVDPIDDYDFTDPMSFNKYSYVRGNPIMGTDPTGMADDNPGARSEDEWRQKQWLKEWHRSVNEAHAREHFNVVSNLNVIASWTQNSPSPQLHAGRSNTAKVNNNMVIPESLISQVEDANLEIESENQKQIEANYTAVENFFDITGRLTTAAGGSIAFFDSTAKSASILRGANLIVFYCDVAVMSAAAEKWAQYPTPKNLTNLKKRAVNTGFGTMIGGVLSGLGETGKWIGNLVSSLDDTNHN